MISRETFSQIIENGPNSLFIKEQALFGSFMKLEGINLFMKNIGLLMGQNMTIQKAMKSLKSL